MAERIILSIAMLASRNKAEVKRCLDSLRPIREAIPSELVVVDTSGDAAVHELCLSYTDRVAEFTWCNDFSKARNVSVEMAKGEWYLFVDDDEWFVEYEELIDFFCSGKYKGYGCANYIQRNFHDVTGTFYSDNWVSRIIRLYPETRFYSKIHEYIAPQIGQCINLRAVVNHTGYIAQTREEKLKKFERNYPLLLQMMEEEPQRLRWRVQIIQELNNVQKWSQLQQFCQESLRVTTECSDPQDYRDIGTFYAGLLTALVELKLYEAALGVEKAIALDGRLSRLCRVYCALVLARLHFAKKEYDKAEAQLLIYREGQEYFAAHPDELAEQEGALLVGTAFDGMCKRRALSLAIGCGLARGDVSALREQYDALGWDRPVMYVSDDLFPVLVDAMAKFPDDGTLAAAMGDLWNNKEAAAKLFAAIEGKRAQDEGEFWNLLRMTARMNGDFWYIWYAKLLVAEQDHSGDRLAEDFRGFCKNTPDIFMTPSNVTDLLKRYGVSIEEGYLSVPFARWQEQLIHYIEKVPLSDILVTEQELLAMRTRESVHIDYALVRLSEAKILHCAGTGQYEAKRECFAEFAKRASAFGRRYYREEVIEAYPELLPEYVQAGILLEQAFSDEADVQKAAALMRQAAQAHAGIAEAVKAFLQATADEQLARERAAKEELRQLEEKIKGQVRVCIDGKQYEAALQILGQLRELKPHDLEAAELLLRARVGQLEQDSP